MSYLKTHTTIFLSVALFTIQGEKMTDRITLRICEATTLTLMTYLQETTLT